MRWLRLFDCKLELIQGQTGEPVARFWFLVSREVPLLGVGVLDANHDYLGKTFFESWRLEFRRHLAHYVFWDLTLALGVALDAEFYRNVKEYGLDFEAESAGHLDPLAAFVRREVGGVDVVPRHLRDEACAQ